VIVKSLIDGQEIARLPIPKNNESIDLSKGYKEKDIEDDDDFGSDDDEELK
jgi:hypothetical protein